MKMFNAQGEAKPEGVEPEDSSQNKRDLKPERKIMEERTEPETWDTGIKPET